MRDYRRLTDAEIEATLASGEIPEALRRAAEKVVVVWTQDWCPDWHAVDAYLGDFVDRVAVYVLEYNRHPAFERILTFKEEVWGNREIPYLRYYHGGRFIVATNRLPRGTFEALLTRTEPFTIR